TGNAGTHATGLTVNSDGTIQLTGSGVSVVGNTGTVIASGTINAANLRAGETGGTVQILGDKVGVVGANINASGSNAGGTVLIGGEYKGQGTIPNASQTYVSQDSAILADALLTGNGGRVIVWADEATRFSGSISARGGNNSGNGGFVEISGKESLSFDGTVDLSAPQGNLGTLLLDPANILIVESADPNNNAELDDGRIFANDWPWNDTFVITRERLESLTGDIILEATNNITIEDLPGDELNLQTGPGETVTFTANADGIGFDSFSMNESDTLNTRGGNVIISGGHIEIGNINTNTSFLSSAGGDIILTSGGRIETGNLNTSAFSVPLGNFSIPASGGNIILKAPQEITTGTLNAAISGTGTGGDISLESERNVVSNINTSSGGDILLNGVL
ncbi:MAG TPA: hypothetical protein VIQ31_39905, partial [Phormidium sp.]